MGKKYKNVIYSHTLGLSIGLAISMLTLPIIKIIAVNSVDSLSTFFENKLIFAITYILVAELIGIVLGMPIIQTMYKDNVNNTKNIIKIENMYKICKKIILVEIVLSVIIFVAL